MALTFTIHKIAVSGTCPECGNKLKDLTVKPAKSGSKDPALNRDIYVVCCPSCQRITSSGKVTETPIRIFALNSSIPGKYVCPNGCDFTSNVRGNCTFCGAKLVTISF